MNRFSFTRFLPVFTLIVLGVFVTTFLETTRSHFFHDLLPENDAAFFARRAACFQAIRFQPASMAKPAEPCPFSRLLSFLEASSHGVPVSPLRGSEISGASLRQDDSSPVFEPVFSHQARGPPIL